MSENRSWRTCFGILRQEVFCTVSLLLALAVCPRAESDSTTAPNGSAQSVLDASSKLEEITVTAQRRSQSIQDVAISMTAFSDQQIKQLGMNSVQDLAQFTPNVSFETFYDAGKPLISIRGYSIGALFTNFEQSPVGIYNDDVYMGSRSGQLGQMFDLDRVEVLRGPQGTLFGRNTAAGAINFIAKKPSNELEADGELAYGRWNEIDVNGGVNIPISETVSIRIAGIQRLRDGWQFDVNPSAPENRLDNVNLWGLRTLLQWKPSSDTTWLLNVHGNGSNSRTPVVHNDLGRDGSCSPNAYTGYQVPCAWNQVASDAAPREVLNSTGESLTGTMQFGEFAFTSIAAHERVEYRESEDDDDSPYAVGTFSAHDFVEQYSQEFRLAAKQGHFDWIAGLYFYTDHLTQDVVETSFLDSSFAGTPLGDFGAIASNYPTQASHNQAVFGDLRYALATQWTVDLGARYTHESKHVQGGASLNLPPFNTGTYQTIGGPGNPDPSIIRSWSAPTGRLALEYRPAKDIMSYASWSRGFKSGGFNGLAFYSVSQLAPYDPETDNTYEVGLKTGWFGGRVTANAAVFFNKVDNLQVLDFEAINGLTYFFVRNAANGTSKGAEFEVRAQPGGGWNFSLGLGLLNTRYDKYTLPSGIDYAGEEFVNAPKVNGNMVVQYTFALLGGTLGPDVSYAYKGSSWTDNAHRPGIDQIPGYGVLDATIPWTSSDGRLRVSLWGNNLTNKHYYYATIGDYAAAYGAAGSYHALPTTYGIRIGYTYH